MTKPSLEQTFVLIIQELQVPVGKRGTDWYFTQEYNFTAEHKWKFDFAWVMKRVAVEIQGGIYNGGGHNSIKGLERDYRKLNYAQSIGWTVLQFSAAMLRDKDYVKATLFKALYND